MLHDRLPAARPAARRGARPVGDRIRGRATSARCGRASTSTRATSAACCARSKAAGLVTVGTNPPTSACAPRGSRAPAAASVRCSTRAATSSRPRSSNRSTTHQQARLVAAMRDVERLLTARLIEITATDPDEPDARRLHRCVLRRARHTLRHGLRSGAEHLRGRRRAAPARRRAPRRAPAVATDRLRRVEVPSPRPDRDQAHVGRARRHAVSASGANCSTRSNSGPANTGAAGCGSRRTAASPKRSRCTAAPGYVEVDAFNAEPYAHHWFEKRLSPGRR